MLSSQEMQIIKNYISENKNAREIAVLMNRPYGQIIKIIHKFGLKEKINYQFWSKEDETYLRTLISEGNNIEQISTILN